MSSKRVYGPKPNAPKTLSYYCVKYIQQQEEAEEIKSLIEEQGMLLVVQLWDQLVTEWKQSLEEWREDHEEKYELVMTEMKKAVNPLAWFHNRHKTVFCKKCPIRIQDTLGGPFRTIKAKVHT